MRPAEDGQGELGGLQFFGVGVGEGNDFFFFG